jgi:uncharacterized membrane protein YkoI
MLTAMVMIALAATDGAAARSRDRGNDDQDFARRALQRGEVMPIARILALAAERLPGDVIEVKLDRRRGRLVYEIKVLTPSGQIRELVLDARTGDFMGIED